MKEDIKSFGEQLKQRRKEMNISLKEAENATSIRIGYLQAIEDGEFKKLISPVYAHGFVRQYAAFLGVDGDQIIRGELTEAHLCHRLRIFGSNALHLHGDILVDIYVVAGSAHCIDIVRLVCGGIDGRSLFRIAAGAS